MPLVEAVPAALAVDVMDEEPAMDMDMDDDMDDMEAAAAEEEEED